MKCLINDWRKSYKHVRIREIQSWLSCTRQKGGHWWQTF